MKGTWKKTVGRTGAVLGALVLGATALTGVANAQTPAPAAAPAQAVPQSPPMRVYGSAQLNGAAPTGANARVTAMVGTTDCTTAGTGTVSASGAYSVDVLSASSKPGCGTDGATVSFMIGTARATQTVTYQQGAFKEQALSAQSATPTPTRTATPAPTPTRTATPAPTPTRTATAAPTPTPARTATAAPPTVVRTPTAVASPAGQRPAGAPQAAAPSAQRPAGAAPAALPRTGTGVQADTSMTMGYVLGGLALAVLALGATGFVAYRRSR